MLNRILFKPILFHFCKFKYFKDLASEIGYPIFKINQELGYAHDRQCWLLGYQLKTPRVQPPSIPNPPQATPQPMNIDEPKQKRQVELQYNPLAKQFLTFGDIQIYAKKNDMDVCLADEQANQVTLIKLRQSVYRKFYQARIHKKNSNGKKHKQIRVPEKISDHDILNKVANIRSLIKKGDYKFKLFSENDSIQSQKAVRKLCQYLGRAPQIKIEKYELQEKSRGKKSIIIERWNAIMDFSQQSKIDYEQVNRKWRRHLINLKVKEQRGDKKSVLLDFEGLENQSIEVQRQALRDMRQMKIQLPSKFKDYQLLEDMMEMDGKQFYFKNSQKIKKYRDSIIKKSQIQSKNNVANDQNSQSESESGSQSESDSQSQSEQGQIKQGRRLKNRNLQALQELQATPQQLKEMRKSMRARTVEDILQQIQQLQKNKIQLDAFEAQRLKVLEKQLKETLRMGGFKQKL